MCNVRWRLAPYLRSVRTLDEFADKLRETALVPVSAPAPAAAFGGRKVAFAYTPGFGLLEFVESTEAPDLIEFAHPLLSELRASFMKVLPFKAAPGTAPGPTAR